MKVTPKIDASVISVRLGNQKASVSSNSKILAPIQKLNLSSKGTANTTESQQDS